MRLFEASAELSVTAAYGLGTSRGMRGSGLAAGIAADRADVTAFAEDEGPGAIGTTRAACFDAPQPTSGEKIE
jgi:hypothetical protein